MAVTHTWKIKNLTQLNDGSGTVKSVQYELFSTDGEISEKTGGFIYLDTENIENFIQYENLTEEVILGWVKEVLESELSYPEADNENRINFKKNPPAPTFISTPLPWEN